MKHVCSLNKTHPLYSKILKHILTNQDSFKNLQYSSYTYPAKILIQYWFENYSLNIKDFYRLFLPKPSPSLYDEYDKYNILLITKESILYRQPQNTNKWHILLFNSQIQYKKLTLSGIPIILKYNKPHNLKFNYFLKILLTNMKYINLLCSMNDVFRNGQERYRIYQQLRFWSDITLKLDNSFHNLNNSWIKSLLYIILLFIYHKRYFPGGTRTIRNIPTTSILVRWRVSFITVSAA